MSRNPLRIKLHCIVVQIACYVKTVSSMWVVYLVVAAGFMFSTVTWLRRSRPGATGVPKGPRGYPILGMYLFLSRWPRRNH